MGHVFISYSHRDSKYAYALAAHLIDMGFGVWIDERLDYGSQWPHEIQKQLDSCDAFILVMTPRSFASEWVQSELQRAKRKLKPMFPLLLEGDEPWLSVESTQYFDVREGTFPDEKFYTALKRVMTPGAGFLYIEIQKREGPSWQACQTLRVDALDWCSTGTLHCGYTYFGSRVETYGILFTDNRFVSNWNPRDQRELTSG